MDEQALATLRAVVAAPAEPADGDAITDREILDTRTDFGDLAGDFVAQSQRPGQAGEVTGNKVSVGATDAAGADADPHFAARRRRGLDLGELQRRTRGLYVNCFM